MRRSVLAWLLLLTLPARACLQGYGEDPSDTWQRVNTLPLQQYRQALLTPAHDLAYWSTAKSRYGAQLSPEDPYTRTNYAVTLLHLGEVEEALALLQDIEQETPGLYATAANLGTALELAGDNSVALHWIQEGINRNPESHQGSEWVHVKILQAKLALEKNPEWLKTHSVLGIDCGERPAARWPRDFDETRARAVIQALQYQLQERLPLIKAPDPVAGDLLFDLGNLKALDGKFDHCLVALELAEKYGTLRPARMRLRHYMGQF